MEYWKIEVSPSGALKFVRQMPFARAKEKALQATGTVLDVSDTLSLSRGKIGLGGDGRGPVWENFQFQATEGVEAPSQLQNTISRKIQSATGE